MGKKVKKNPKIVFLDAASLDLGDLDMSPVFQLGSYRALPRSAPGKLPKPAQEADILLTNKVELGEAELAALPQLKLICVTATGVNNIDLPAAQACGIAVCNVAGYSTPSVVEHALMMLLSFSHRLLEHDGACKSGAWSRSPLFTLLDYPFAELRSKTLGIIGYGHIGRQVGRIAKAFGMQVIVAKLPGRNYAAKKEKKNASVKRVPLSLLLRQSDFVSLHCALSDKTKHLMNAQSLALMKPSAYLINMARGPIVEEQAVAEALNKNRLAGYGTDVTATEPIPKNHPFLKKTMKHKVILTPHVAWASRESRQRLVDELGKNIAAFLKGKKRNRLV